MELNDLLELEKIKRAKYKYMRCIDQKLWDEIGDVFTDDAVAAYSGGKYRYEGRDAIVDFLRTSMGSEGMLSAHRLHQPEIDLTGPDTAVGTWAMDDIVIITEYDITIRGAAFYEDRYVKVGDDWKIALTTYKRSFEEIQSRADTPNLRLTASWWATGGVSEIDV